MAEDIQLDSYELNVLDGVSGSLGFHQRRLFSQLNLSSYLQHRNDLALRQFNEGCREADLNLLVERTHERFGSVPLWLDDEVVLQSNWNLSDGSQEFQFGIKFSGDALFWECSPDPVHDRLPEGSEFSNWFLPPGETMERPYGEIYRDNLVLIAREEPQASDLEKIRTLIAWQTVIIEKSNKQLEIELYMLAETFEAMDYRSFTKWV
ncbi:hypothetical protein A9995_09650 [Erythrobacter sp. QSSC1-22B]|uniref:hypothetical protein n=1 Tax=Erythrobacter sp. QSSC1-22B TaxID=1860125 RepID=UPI000804E8E4|nr:hypothetical protein [Erythrobacter sp. QSSC1-22B]OBX18818.1 hypothetical protein A9995_09650 [Erythrobacter sp. QSSC1-22B]